MESRPRKRKPKSIGALVFLTLISVGFLLFGLVTITCGFVLNYHDDFKASKGGKMLETIVESQVDYTQYWLGFPFLITSALLLASGVVQKDRSLTIMAFISLFICIILSLFALVLEGYDWMKWNHLDRFRNALEDDYSCLNEGQMCVCKEPTTNKIEETVHKNVTCSNIKRLSGLFGAITASAIFGIFFSLAGIVIILKSLSWKPRYYLAEYGFQKAGPWYNNGGYTNGAVPRYAGESKSMKGLPLY